MIQDAHPVRSGVPDCYQAKYKIDIVAAASNWAVSVDRFPSGFGGVVNGAGQLTQNAFVSTGLGRITFPAGMRVRSSDIHVEAKVQTGAGNFHAFLNNINEAAGTADIVVTAIATSTLTNPTTGAVIWAELDLETV